MKVPTYIKFLWTLFLVKSATATNNSVIFITSTVVSTSTVPTNDTVAASRTGATTLSFSSHPTASAYPACISFVNGSAVAVPINGSAPYPTTYINSIAASSAPTGTSDFNDTTLSPGPTDTTGSTLVISTTTETPPPPSSLPFAPRQNPSQSDSTILSTTAPPPFSNASQTVTVVYPSNFGGTNASATYSIAVIAYPTAYPSQYPSVLPLCADLGANASGTIAINNSLPNPTSNGSAADNTLNQPGDHSEASRVGKSLLAAFLSVSIAFAALYM